MLEAKTMAYKRRGMVLVTFYNDSGEPMEFVLRGVTQEQLADISAFLQAEFPDGSPMASYIGTEKLSDFDDSMGGDFRDFVTARRRAAQKSRRRDPQLRLSL